MKRRTDWDLNRFDSFGMLRMAMAAVAGDGDWVEAGAMALRFNLADCIQTGNSVEAARYTRHLVRHLRANGRLYESA